MARDGTKLVAGQYAVDLARALPEAGGGLPAYAATDARTGRGGLMAVRVAPRRPLRLRAITALASTETDGILLPLAHGVGPGPDGREACYVICPAPPGPPIATDRPWSESELIECVLRPVAGALDMLHARGVTHRAIRPGNLFRAGPGQPVVLGCAWAAPPASLQPVAWEPPYSACCGPNARGDGRAADDIYALGVTLLALALGRLPGEGEDDEEMILRKLDQGSFAALAGNERLPPAIGDLVRGMLAEDPEHRPPAVLLTHPSVARARRVAARPPRRAQKPIEVGGRPAWNARTLAHLLAHDPEAGTRLLRTGLVSAWLRRGLGDAALAIQLEDALLRPAPDDHRHAAEGARLRVAASEDEAVPVRAVALLDPLAPLWWKGRALWPDGLGDALAEAEEGAEAAWLESLVMSEVIATWAEARPERCDVGALRQDAQLHRLWLRIRGPNGGLTRLLYTLNPALPCASPLLDGRWVARPADLLPALEAAAASRASPGPPGGPLAGGTWDGPLDRHVGAFLSARDDSVIRADTPERSETGPAESVLAQLRTLARLQARHGAPPLPALAGWFASGLRGALSFYRSRKRRERLGARLAKEAEAGHLPSLLAVLDDPGELARDAAEAEAASARLRAIDAELQALAADSARPETARRIGREIAVAGGMLATAAALVLAALG